jgi:hypothetical protein
MSRNSGTRSVFRFKIDGFEQHCRVFWGKIRKIRQTGSARGKTI